MEDWKTRVTEIRQVHPATLSGQACLVLIYSGVPGSGDIGRRYELTGDDVLIGRGADADIQIDRDSVSRRHARLYRGADGNWCVSDLASTNGSYVNDVQIHDHTLHDGELLKIGNAIFKFLSGPSIEAAYYEEIYRMTIMDGLTQTYNKRYFLENLERELARCARYRRSLSLVMFDIDHFKHINDNHGHLTGDFVLRELARRVRGQVRKEMIFARYGGEEFTVTLPEATRQAAVEFAERIRKSVESASFDFEGERIPVTISLGVATVDKEVEPPAFVRLADENLYRAKRGGRNKVVG